MTYRLHIDDQAGDSGVEAFRNPPDDTWMVARSSYDAIKMIDWLGPPCYISFDHDLATLENGEPDTAMKVINYLIENHYDAEIDYDVHSQNPIGRLNIIAKMDSWKKSKSL